MKQLGYMVVKTCVTSVQFDLTFCMFGIAFLFYFIYNIEEIQHFFHQKCSSSFYINWVTNNLDLSWGHCQDQINNTDLWWSSKLYTTSRQWVKLNLWASDTHSMFSYKRLAQIFPLSFCSFNSSLFTVRWMHSWCNFNSHSHWCNSTFL